MMQSAPKELLKEYVQSQQFTSTADIMQAMKEMFRNAHEDIGEDMVSRTLRVQVQKR